MRKTFDPAMLTHFTGTAQYYRIGRRHLLTDGTKYLAEEAECFWMMDAIASHVSEIGTHDWFVQVKVQVHGIQATMIYDDGNGNELARQVARMVERGISKEEVEATLANPVRRVDANRGRTESQGFIERAGKKQLLRVLSEGQVVVLVITVMATSKFEKYGVSP